MEVLNSEIEKLVSSNDRVRNVLDLDPQIDKSLHDDRNILSSLRSDTEMIADHIEQFKLPMN